MRKFTLVVSVIFASLFFSCSDDLQTEVDLNDPQPKIEGLINQEGQADGVKYNLRNVTVNPKLVLLNAENSKLLSTEGEIENGIYRVEILSNDASANITVGNVLYLRNANKVYLRTIKTVEQNSAVYELNTEDAHLGDLIESGSLEFSIDVQKAEETLLKKSLLLRSSEYEQNFTFDILNFIKEYEAGGMTYSPNSSLKTFFDVKIVFKKGLPIVPAEFSFVYEIKPVFNPKMTFAQSMSKEFEVNMIDYVPENLIDLLKTIELDIVIPAGSLGNIPAKVSIEEIQFPSYIVANLTNASSLEYNVGGSLKVGYAHYNNVAGKESGFIYENTIVAEKNPDININGEVASDMKIIITPKVSIIDNSILTSKGNISFGFNTVTSAIKDSNKLIKGSKGVFTTSAIFDIYALGVPLISNELFKDEKVLWNVGEFNNKMEFSNLKLTKPSKIPCSILSYDYNISLDYKYPISGKKISGTIEITYDVYDDKNKLLKSGEKSIFTPSNLTAGNFSFNLCIPFRADAFAWAAGFMRPTSIIKNVVLKDSNGNVGTLSDFTVGSPYNNSFWK